MTQSADFGHLGPMIDAARAELAAAGVTAQPEVVVADPGYRHLEQMNALTGAGIPVLIPPDSSRRKSARPGWSGGPYDSCAASCRPTTAARPASNEPS
jgi:hypothetical protein